MQSLATRSTMQLVSYSLHHIRALYSVHTKLASDSMLFSLPNTHSIQNCISNKPTNPNKLWASTPVSSVPSRAPSPSAVQSPPVSLNQAEEAPKQIRKYQNTSHWAHMSDIFTQKVCLLEKSPYVSKCKRRMSRKLGGVILNYTFILFDLFLLAHSSV